MIKFLKKIFSNLFTPKIVETETHYLVELYSDDGFCYFWLEKEDVGDKDL